MSRGDTGLLVVDVQEKLVPAVISHQRLLWNLRRLIDAARLLSLPSAATEQYPKGLGRTMPELADSFPECESKLAFSCGACPATLDRFAQAGVSKLLVAGIETHVCIQQTVFDLLAAGYRVYIPVDAVSSRGRLDHDVALRRMESSGAVLTTTESALFEWCETAASPEFKSISQLVRQSPPVEPSP